MFPVIVVKFPGCHPFGAFREEKSTIKNEHYGNGHRVTEGMGPGTLQRLVREARAQHDPTRTAAGAPTLLVDGG